MKGGDLGELISPGLKTNGYSKMQIKTLPS